MVFILLKHKFQTSGKGQLEDRPYFPRSMASLPDGGKVFAMTVMIVDDSCSSAELLQAQLVSVAEKKTTIYLDPKDALQACLQSMPDLVITDFVMPQMDGADFTKEFRKLKNNEDVPIIVVTTKEDRDTRLRCLHAGANDFLSKPVDEIELQARVRNMLKLRARSVALSRAISRLQDLATTDELTSVNNRRHFLEILRTEMNRAKRYNWPLSVAMVDADHFKQVNDRFGHAIGDNALAHLAHLFCESVRDHDAVGRLGGEEFALCLPVTSIERAKMVTERVRRRVAETGLRLPDGDELNLTVSIGLVQWQGVTEDSASFLARADRALYRAKERGRNRIEHD